MRSSEANKVTSHEDTFCNTVKKNQGNKVHALREAQDWSVYPPVTCVT